MAGKLAWALTAIVSVAFMAAGASKLAFPDTSVANFLAWGYPLWVSYAVGVFEVAAALAIWHPKSMFYAVKVIGALMVGAMITHAIHAEWTQIITNLVLLGMASMVAIMRRDDWPPWVESLWLRFAKNA